MSFAITLGPISWVYLAEIMTEKGMSIAVCVNWCIVIIVSYFPSMMPSLSQHTKHHDGKDNPYMLGITNTINTESDLSYFFFFFAGF